MVFGVTDNVCQGYSRMCKLCKLSVTNCKKKRYLGWYGILHSSLRPLSSNSRYLTVNVLTLQLPVIFLYCFNHHLFKHFLTYFLFLSFYILSYTLPTFPLYYYYITSFFSFTLLYYYNFLLFTYCALGHLINGSRHSFDSFYIFLRMQPISLAIVTSCLNFE